MIDWNLVGNIVGGGFGVTFLVLIILSVVIWIAGLVIQKVQAKDKEIPAKEK
ncbi:OadG family protein [Chloroflexota bacterium]